MNYYIVGTKYKQSDSTYLDNFPELVRRNLISTGFSLKYNLSKLCGKPESEIVEYLKSKGEPPKAYRTLKIFLNLQPGDLVAIKKSGAPIRKVARLVISGYAVVSGINKPIYSYYPKYLGHALSVEFIETDIHKEFKLGYGQTIHKLSDKTHIKKIFGDYYEVSIKGHNLNVRKGVVEKNTNSYTVTNNKSYIASALHNTIQQKLFEKLRSKYGKNKVYMERNFVDITVINETSITLYEVKPYSTATQCIREALGQLLEYGWKEHCKYPINLIVVGPRKPDKKEVEYIKYLKNDIGVDFDYMQFNA